MIRRAAAAVVARHGAALAEAVRVAGLRAAAAYVATGPVGAMIGTPARLRDGVCVYLIRLAVPADR